ncbi:MAG: hypothetical protein GEU90_04635 [Gemmatimonas sp.]|nr:hypothetical protein [Gemmatimonas sp.]
MPQIIMYWDGITPLGDPTAGMEILNAGNQFIEIPPEACGFRLGIPGEPWYDSWFFAEPNNYGTFQHQGITYSSSFTGSSPSAIEAVGPVHGCVNGSYAFQTPLGDFGISGDDPVVAGAGSFVAEFADASEITWLDFAGAAVELPDVGGEDPESPELPPEFFEEPPEVEGCYRDFLGQLQCPPDAFPHPEEIGPGTPGLTGTELSPTAHRLHLPRGVAALVAAESGVLPRIKSITRPQGEVTRANTTKVEVACPAELVLNATFFKSSSAPPGTVLYRFRFVHGPISTVFSTLVDQDGPNHVSHSVPIPLPPPIRPDGSGGGGRPPGTATNLAIYFDPGDVGPPGGGTPPVIEPHFAVDALPSNEHKSSVRVEVLNAFEGVVSSSWMTYHLVCVNSSDPPVLGPGVFGASVTSLQATINRWLRSQGLRELRVDGIFGSGTEEAVKMFQRGNDLREDGLVARRTWHNLLATSGGSEDDARLLRGRR